MYYTGIGSRETPSHICNEMRLIACLLFGRGYILRSGGADGADLAFEEGAANRKEIFLPWKGFNGSTSSLYNINPLAFEIASKYHPVWHQLKDSHKKMHARNVHQVLGLNLNDPVDFVVCYTVDGKLSGGTATAMRIARDKDIPIFNLFYDKDLVELYMKIDYMD